MTGMCESPARLADELEVPLGRPVGRELGQEARRLGEGVGPGDVEPVVLVIGGHDVLLEERRQDDGPDTGRLEPLEGRRVVR